MKKHILISVIFPIIVLAACGTEEKETMNPFLSEYNTPFGVPPFDIIKIEHYVPAFHEGIKQQEANTKSMEVGIRHEQDQQRINEEIRRDTMERLGAEEERMINAQRPQPQGNPGGPNNAGGIQ